MRAASADDVPQELQHRSQKLWGATAVVGGSKRDGRPSTLRHRIGRVVCSRVTRARHTHMKKNAVCHAPRVIQTPTPTANPSYSPRRTNIDNPLSGPATLLQMSAQQAVRRRAHTHVRTHTSNWQKEGPSSAVARARPRSFFAAFDRTWSFILWMVT